MTKTLFDTQAVYFIIAAIAGIGLLFRILEASALRAIISKIYQDGLGEDKPDNSFLSFLKKEYTKKYLSDKKVNNVEAFVDKYIINKKFCGLKLLTYKQICGWLMWATAISTVLFSILGQLNLRGQNEILSTFFAGTLSLAVLITVDCIIGFDNRLKEYKIVAVNYIENEYLPYISTEENVKEAVKETLASRQKKILMEEKESKRTKEEKEPEVEIEISKKDSNADMIEEILSSLFAS